MPNTPETTQNVKKDDDVRIVGGIERGTPIELEFRMSGEREQLLGMPKEYSGWDVYNNEAKKVDTELVSDWRTSLNSLLLFAAIFAAVLTGFIIESKKLLELDPSEAMLDVMISFTNSMANGSFTPYSRPSFEPKSSSITINCLFFASLSASLVAALASVMALQWVADYDAAITRGGSSPEDRAKRRQFRYAGVRWWKMNEIIAALPLLLYSSFVLFLSGLTLWMWDVHQTVGSVVAGGMSLAVLFYGATTSISVVSVSAPFRTPLSRFIYSFTYLIFPIIDSLSRRLPIPSIQAWLQDRHQRHTGAVKRDDDEVKRRQKLGMDALVWLANHLSISLDSYERLLLLVNELRKQNREYFTSPRFKKAPWFAILDLLGWKNLNTAGRGSDISEEEMRAVAILAHCYRVPKIYEIIQPTDSISYFSEEEKEKYWSQCCDIERTQWAPSTGINSLFLLLRDVPLPSKDTTKQLESTIRLSRWRNSLKQGQEEATLATNSPLTTQDSALSVDRVRRIVTRCIKNNVNMTSSCLDALGWHLECIFLESAGHNMETAACLSRPLLYYKAFHGHPELQPLHGDFTLMLARSINSISGAELVLRVKEVITMMWIRNGGRYSSGTLCEKQGLENFFNANRSLLLKWVHYMQSVPHIHEVLEHLALAQARQPDVGSLWRDPMTQTNIPGLLSVLGGFNDVISQSSTPEQHRVFIDLVCQDVELCPRGAFTGDHSAEDVPIIGALTDQSLAFMVQLSAGAQVEFVTDASSFKESWIRIVEHLMKHYEGTDSPRILKLQASAWFLAPVQFLCRKALREPQTLAWLKRIFDYPVKCTRKGHKIGEGHLLLHILDDVYFHDFPVNLPALTEFQKKSRDLNSLLAVLILSDGYENQLRDCMRRQNIDETCTNQLFEMVSMLISSQHSMLATLSATSLLEDHPAELAGFLICVNKALDLPDDQRATSLIRPFISQVHALVKNLGQIDGIPEREAAQTVQRLRTYLGRLIVTGRTNCQVLSCAQASGTFSPATGWLAPCTE